MESNRSDNRRRRVLYDEAVQQTAIAANPPEAAPKKRRFNGYNPRGIQQLKTSDLIPTRLAVMSLVSFGSLVAVAGVNLLDAFAVSESSVLHEAVRRAFDLLSPVGLATWLASLIYTLAGLFSLQVYSLRRHRRDDYRGTYRVWILFALLCFFAGLQSIVPLVQLGMVWIAQSLRSPVLTPGHVANASIALSLILALFLRAIFEIRSSRLAVTHAVVALLLFSASVATVLPSLQQRIPPDRLPWVLANLHLVGSIAILNCCMAFARFVWLDASGMIQRRQKSRRRKTRSARQRRSTSRSASQATARREINDSSTAAKREQTATASRPIEPNRAGTTMRDAVRSGPLRSKIEALKSQDEDDEDESWEEESSPTDERSRLSKAERRRLKRLQRRQRHAA